MRRARLYFGTGVWLVVILAVLAGLVSVPLLTVYKSSDCRGRDVRYSFVAPGDDPPRDCRKNENGFELLRGELGLD